MEIIPHICKSFKSETGFQRYEFNIKNQMGKILVASGEKTQLMEIFSTSHVTIRRALNGTTNTPLAIRIRKAAIERGGVEQPEKKQL